MKRSELPWWCCGGTPDCANLPAVCLAQEIRTIEQDRERLVHPFVD